MAARPELRPVAPGLDPMSPVPFEVRQVIRETADTYTLVLDPPDAASGFRFAPGQFNMLYIFGVGEVPISISGDPARPGTLVHTIRAVGNVTRAMQRLGRGDVVGVRGPFGSAWPVEQASGHDLVIVAGGIGLAPLRPVLYYLLAHRGMYGKVVLLYGARSPHEMLYPKELQQWRGRFDLDIEVTVDRATIEWQGGVGVVTKLIARSPFDPESTMAFLCGPEIMIRYSVRELLGRGVDPRSIAVSLERNMKCGIGFCGHCQHGPDFVCKDGPVFRYDRVESLFGTWEV